MGIPFVKEVGGAVKNSAIALATVYGAVAIPHDAIKARGPAGTVAISTMNWLDACESERFEDTAHCNRDAKGVFEQFDGVKARLGMD